VKTVQIDIAGIIGGIGKFSIVVTGVDYVEIGR